MVSTSKRELEIGITPRFQQQTLRHPNNRIRIVSHFLSTPNLKFLLNSILEIISMHPNKALELKPSYAYDIWALDVACQSKAVRSIRHHIRIVHVYVVRTSLLLELVLALCSIEPICIAPHHFVLLLCIATLYSTAPFCIVMSRTNLLVRFFCQKQRVDALVCVESHHRRLWFASLHI
jgi:hypothetical protein